MTAAVHPDGEGFQELRATLDRLYPGRIALLLTPLCGAVQGHRHPDRKGLERECEAPGKRPLRGGWNDQAARRFDSGDGREEYLDAIAHHIARGENVGWAVPPGVAVLDADTPAAVAWLSRALPDAPMQHSRPGRGHFVVRVPLDLEIDATVKRTLAPGIEIDVRSANRSQIAVEPSRHVTGATYSWRRELPADLADLPACPPLILGAIAAPAPKRSNNNMVNGRGVPQGERNAHLFRIAAGMRGRGLTEREILAELQRENTHYCVPPLAADEVAAIAASALRYPAGDGARPEAGQPSVALVASVAGPYWPKPLGDAAYHGLAGELVRLVEPHTEADPVALLLDFLGEFGSVIGRSAYFVAEADRHYGNLFVALVGSTSRGRKGSSHGQVRARVGAVDSEWATSRIMSGLSSGEGLIWQVRDAIEKLEAIREKGRVTGYQNVITDEGQEDKRLLVFEPELASTLRTLAREGNTLSAVIRCAWDSGNLRTLTKNTPAHATDAHISILGHITKDELLRYLDRTEAGNGFANRFLWACVRRSKLLPEGGKLDTVDFRDFAGRLHKTVALARQREELRRDDEARDLWIEVYPKLSAGRPGLLGAVTSRAEAQVMRLALLYALLDCANEIGKKHLEAALEVWRYCAESAQTIFGASLGDPDADAINHQLQTTRGGLTRTELRDFFGRHRPGAQIDRALASLAELGLAHCKPEDTGGRPAERWFAGVAAGDQSDRSDERTQP